MKSLLSRQALFYLYQEFVSQSHIQKLPIQEKISEKQVDEIWSIIQAASNTIFGIKLYPGIIDKAGFILYSLNKKHILLDGNKRFSLIIVLYLFEIYEINAKKLSKQDWEMLVMRIASDHHFSQKQTIKYLKEKLKK